MTPSKTAFASILMVTAAMSFSGCGSSSEQPPRAGDTPTASSGQPTASATQEPPAPTDPTVIANAIKARQPAFTKVTRITEDNDGNNLIGRPNGYDAAAALFIGDSLDSCDTSDPIGVDCGAVIERWPNASAAKKRKDYIQGILKDAPMLGSEYDTVHGRFIFRVAGDVKPSVAAAYKAAFLAIVD